MWHIPEINACTSKNIWWKSGQQKKWYYYSICCYAKVFPDIPLKEHQYNGWRINSSHGVQVNIFLCMYYSTYRNNLLCKLQCAVHQIFNIQKVWKSNFANFFPSKMLTSSHLPILYPQYFSHVRYVAADLYSCILESF